MTSEDEVRYALAAALPESLGPAALLYAVNTFKNRRTPVERLTAFGAQVLDGLAPVVEDLIARAESTGSTHRETEWGIRFGDGEIESYAPDEVTSAAEVIGRIRELRAAISERRVETDDYEPMVVVRRARAVTTVETPWEVVP